MNVYCEASTFQPILHELASCSTWFGNLNQEPEVIASVSLIRYMGDPRAQVVDHRTPKSDVEPLFDDNQRSETKVLKVPNIKFAIFALDDRNLFNQIRIIFRLDNHLVSTGSRLDAKLSDISWSTS